MPAHFCYILQNALRPYSTYNGYTVDPDRRLRQHNCDIRGGAKATARLVGRGGKWTFLAIVAAEGLTHRTGLSLEWHCRYPTCRKPRPSHLQGPAGRVRGLAMALAHPKFAHLTGVTVRIDALWQQAFADAVTTPCEIMPLAIYAGFAPEGGQDAVPDVRLHTEKKLLVDRPYSSMDGMESSVTRSPGNRADSALITAPVASDRVAYT